MQRKLIAEIIGTFCLVFTGCGAIVVNKFYGDPLGHVGICLVFGLIVMSMIYAVGNISGAHLNPAVTISFVVARRNLSIKTAIAYIIAQIIGALIAAFLLKFLFPEDTTFLGATLPAGGAVMRAFVMEVLLSFILMFVILNVSTGHMEKGIMAGVAIGGTVALDALVGGPVCGASMNPVRSLAPALASGNLSHLWVYIVAPVIGTILASPSCRLIQGSECCHVNENDKSGCK